MRATQLSGKGGLTIDLPATCVRVILPDHSATSQKAVVFGLSAHHVYLQLLLAALKDRRIEVSTAFKRLIEEMTRVHPQPVLAITATPPQLPLAIIFLPEDKYVLEVGYEVIVRILELMKLMEGHPTYYHGL